MSLQFWQQSCLCVFLNQWVIKALQTPVIISELLFSVCFLNHSVCRLTFFFITWQAIIFLTKARLIHTDETGNDYNSLDVFFYG